MGSETDVGGSAAPVAALQFDKVEVVPPAAANAGAPPSSSSSSGMCAACRGPIRDEYFALGTNIVCGACAARVRGKGGASGFGRALVFGGLAAVAGTIVWYAITRATDHEFGLIAI